MTRHTRARLATIARGLAAVACLTGVVLGVPAALLAYGTNPLSSDLPNWEDIRTTLLRPDDGTLLLAVLQITVWLLWAIFTGFVVAEAVSQLRGRTLPRVPGLAFLQQPAAALVTAIAVLVAINTAVTPLHAAATIVATAPDDPARTPHTVAAPEVQAADKPVVELPRYTVRRYDSLWRIAERHLGDGLRWREIHTLNADHLPNPDHIEPGMILLLPADATGLDHRLLREVAVRPGDTLSTIAQRELGQAALWPTVFDANRGRIQPNGTPFTDPDTLHPGFTVLLPPTSTPAPAPAPPNTPATPPTSPSPSTPPRPIAPSANPTTESPQPTSQPPAPTSTEQHHDSDHEVTLPSGTVVGLSLAAAITAATALLWAHRRHRYHPRPLNQPARPAPLPETAHALRRAHSQASKESPDPSAPTEETQQPGEVSIAFAGHTEIPIDPIRLRGVGLSGPGAHAAARAILAAHLAQHHARDLEFLIPRADFERMFPGADDQAELLPENLTIVDSLAAALTRIEVEHIRRARLLDSSDATDMTSLRVITPDEPLPITLLAATPEERHTRRLAGILQFGAERDIGAVLLGESPTGPTYTVQPDGVATTSHDEPDLPSTVRFFTLSDQEALDLLAVLAQAQGVPPGEPAADDAAVVEPGPARDPDDVPEPPQPATNYGSESAASQRPVSFTLFGPPTLAAHGTEITTGLRSNARELLLYLALHHRGVTQDQALEALWPDTEVSRAREAFHNAVGNIRKVLRAATDLSEEKFVQFTSDRYRLDADTIDVDLWRFDKLLQGARDATDTRQRADALAAATSIYTGQLAADLGLEWLDIEREDLHRRALDAHSALADIQEDTQPERALATLDSAIRHDPYAEALYTRIMLIQMRLGRHDAAQRTYRLLQAHLADIGAEPDVTTQNVLHRSTPAHQARST